METETVLAPLKATIPSVQAFDGFSWMEKHYNDRRLSWSHVLWRNLDLLYGWDRGNMPGDGFGK